MVIRNMSDGDSINRSARWPRAEMVRDSGVALVIVLWVVASAALLVSSFNAIVRSHAKVTTAELHFAKGEAVLDAGLEMAAARLIDDNEATRWPPNGSPHAFQFGGHNLSITIIDPNGLIDLNKTPIDLLLNFLRQFSGSENEAVKVRDGILQVRQMHGGPSEQNTKAKNKIEAEAPGKPNRSQSGQAMILSFIDKTQLRHVPGMSEKLYRKIKPFLTVYGRDGAINPNTAPPQVLVALLDVEENDVKSLSENQRDNSTEADSRDSVLQRANAYLNEVSGPTFIISVVATNPRGKRKIGKEFVITIGLDDQAPYRLISWRSLAPAA